MALLAGLVVILAAVLWSHHRRLQKLEHTTNTYLVPRIGSVHSAVAAINRQVVERLQDYRKRTGVPPPVSRITAPVPDGDDVEVSSGAGVFFAQVKTKQGKTVTRRIRADKEADVIKRLLSTGVDPCAILKITRDPNH